MRPPKGAFGLLGIMLCLAERDAVGRKLTIPLRGLAVLPEGSAIGSMQALCPLSGSGSPNRSFHDCGQGSQGVSVHRGLLLQLQQVV